MSKTTVAPNRRDLNAERRREEHLTRAAARRERKRIRRLRAEIHAAMIKADEMVKASPLWTKAGAFRAPDVKTEQGWQILDIDGNVTYAPSRDKARALAWEMDKMPALTRDDAMLVLGWDRTGPDGIGLALEKKFRRVAPR